MMPPAASPLHVANMAQQMAQKSDGMDAKMFQKVALVSMGCIAFASVAQVVLELLRKHDREHSSHDRGR